MWRQADKYDVPRIVFVNKMDKIGADFFKCVADIIDRVAGKPVCLQLPIGAESSFKGVVDLIKMKAIVWSGEALGANYSEEEIPADLADQAAEYRTKLVEACVEMDDDAMAAYLDGTEPDEDTMRKLVRTAVQRRAFHPVLCGSAFKNKGVQPLLDGVVDYLPSPADRGEIKGIDYKTEEETFGVRSTPIPSPCSPSRSWTIPTSARSPSAACIRARSIRARTSSTRPATRRSGSAACS